MNVKIIDLFASDAANQLVESLKGTGFAVLKNHPINSYLLNEAYDEWKNFFSQSNGTKNLWKFSPLTQAGYFPFKSENAKDSPIKDLKEFHHLFFPFEDVPSDEPYEFEATQVLAHELNQLGQELLAMLDVALPREVYGKLSTDLQNMAQNAPNTLFRTLHYPPLTDINEPGAVRAAAHEDINLITLLPAATQSGLEVKDSQGNWHAVKSDPGTIVVNVGDMLQEATGGYLKSTTHRVTNPTDGSELESRYSMPLFIHPLKNIKLSDRYTADEFLKQRLKEIGLL